MEDYRVGVRECVGKCLGDYDDGHKILVDGDTETEDSSGIDGETMETDDGSIRDQGNRYGMLF